MTALAAQRTPTVCTSFAARLAAERWTENQAALAALQPDVAAVLDDPPVDVEWVMARDGSLTAILADGSWWAGCSVPRIAGLKLLRTLDPSPLVSAYLSPAHAGLMHAARERMGPGPALVAIVPERETARMLLATGEFAADIAAHRLWFVVGEDWADRLRQLLIDHPGLPPVGRFIRSKLTDGSVVEPMIAAAQTVLGEIASARLAELGRLREQPARSPGPVARLLVIAPSRYRLWNDEPFELAAAAEQLAADGEIEVVRFDTDDPASSSPLALARLATDCDAVLAADVYRADAAGLAPVQMPWITWATRGPVPGIESSTGGDHVIRSRRAMRDRPAPASPPHLAVLADLAAVSIPNAVEDLSSHRLLWEYIDAEVDADLLQIGTDPVPYLMSRAEMIGIDREELDVHAFVDGLIVPRWQRAVARRLIADGVRLVLHGQGWAGEPELAAHAAGPVTDRTAFERALDAAAALLHVWPGVASHPIDCCGRPVVDVPTSWPALMAAIRAALRTSGRAVDLQPTLTDAIRHALSAHLPNRSDKN